MSEEATEETVEQTETETTSAPEQASLLHTDAPETATPDAPPAIPEGVRPADLPDKYWDSEKGEVKWENVLKQHNYLESKLGETSQRAGEYFGPPEGDAEYELNLPEGVAGEFDQDNPLLKQFTGPDGLARKLGLSQKGVDALVNLYATQQVADAVEASQAKQKELVSLGDNARQMVADFNDWMSVAVPPQYHAGLFEATQSAEAFKALQWMVGQVTSGSSMPQLRGAGGAAPKISKTDIEEARWEKNEKGQLKYDIDKGHRQRVQQMYKDLHGTQPDVEVVDPLGVG